MIKKNLLKIILSAGALVGSGLFIFPLLISKAEIKNIPLRENAEIIETEIEQDSIITLIAVGDMMLGTNYPNATHLPPNDYDLLGPLQELLKSGDMTFGNLEGTVLNEGGEIKSCGDPTKCYAFRQPESVLKHVKNAGFDFLSIANNHMGDFGETGRKNTQKVLREMGFRYAGLESCPWDTLTVNGLLVGFTAYAPNSGCLQINDYSIMEEIVKKLDKMCDIVIVSFHGGAEGSGKTHTLNSHEIFYGEDRGNVVEFSRKAVDAGADVILGHGPHVSRACDVYKNRFITYSMGNFCTYSRFNLSGISGIAPVYKIYLTKNGELIKTELISIQQLGEGGPILDKENRAFAEVKKLTESDFPKSKLRFENGFLTYERD